MCLVGRSHLDLKGLHRLEMILLKLKPLVVSIEDTEKDFEEALQIAKNLSQPGKLEITVRLVHKKFPYLNPETIRLWLGNACYEARAVSRYAKSQKTPILFSEKQEVLAKYSLEGEKQRAEVMNGLGKFLRLTPEEAMMDVEREYAQESYAVSDNPKLMEFYSERDRIAEAALRKHENVLHVCGLDHLYGDYFNLHDMLKDLNPVRMKLNEAERL